MNHFQHYFFIAILSFLTIFNLDLLAQCPPGSVYVYNQNQVNNFLVNYPNCNEINGSLIISFQSSPEITDLTPFHNIKRVNGDLQAAELNSLPNLNGLQNIEYVQKNLRLNQLPLVTSITEMKSLKEVGEFILILNMPNLISIDSFESLTYVGKSLNITRSPKLKTISGFQQLETINSGVTFELNPELIQIPSFQSLKHVGLSIKIVDAPKLQGRNIFPRLKGSISSLTIDLNTTNPIAFSGFHNLDSIRTDIDLKLPNGTIHNAFQNLKFIGGNVEITTDNSYFDFASELDHIVGYLSITNCSNLKSLGSFDDDLVVNDYIALWNNNSLNICNVPFICRHKEAGNELSIVGGINPCSSINGIDCSNEGISGTFYYDKDQNGQRNTNEEGISNMAVEVPQIGANFISNQNGKYFFNASDGNSYTVNAKIPSGWQLTSQSDYAITFAHNNPQNRFYDFGVYPSFDTSSVNIQLYGSESRCSGYSTLDVNIENTGSNEEEGVVTIHFDNALKFAFSIPIPDSIDEENNNLSWNIKSLTPSEDNKLKAYFQNPATLSNADSVYFEMNAVFGSSVLYEHYSRLFVCSETTTDRKFVLPNDGSNNNLISKDEELVYSVEFQNNSNAELRDISIHDTLSPYLDISTFRILDHSHPINTKIKGNAITFTFDDIFLLDTTFSDNQTQAFISYSVKPLSEVVDGSIIKNTGYIYFNQIQGETTNTVVNTIEGPSAIDELTGTNKFEIYPNPNQGTFILNPKGFPFNHQLEIRITNLHGQLIHKKVVRNNKGSLIYVDENIKPGMYIISVKDLNNQFKAVSKFLVL